MAPGQGCPGPPPSSQRAPSAGGQGASRGCSRSGGVRRRRAGVGLRSPFLCPSPDPEPNPGFRTDRRSPWLSQGCSAEIRGLISHPIVDKPQIGGGGQISNAAWQSRRNPARPLQPSPCQQHKRQLLTSCLAWGRGAGAGRGALPSGFGGAMSPLPAALSGYPGMLCGARSVLITKGIVHKGRRQRRGAREVLKYPHLVHVVQMKPIWSELGSWLRRRRVGSCRRGAPGSRTCGAQAIGEALEAHGAPLLPPFAPPTCREVAFQAKINLN